jgi:hypothetical protein
MVTVKHFSTFPPARGRRRTVTSGASRSVEGSVQHSRTQEIVSSCGEGDTDETIVSRNYCRGGTETRQRHSDLGSRPHTKIKLNKLKMHSWALWPRKDYWNCYCDFAVTTEKVYHTFTLLHMRLAGNAELQSSGSG